MATKALSSAALVLFVLVQSIASGDNVTRSAASYKPAEALEQEMPAALSVPREENLVTYLRNGDLESTSPEGAPLHWTEFRRGFFDTDAALAHSGNISLRASFLYGWSQGILIPVSPYQTFTVAGYALREFADERAGVRSVFYRADGSHITDLVRTSPVDAPPGAYGQFWTDHEIPPEATQLGIFLHGNGLQSWIRFDDLKLYTEQFSTTGTLTGEPWRLSDGAVNAGDMLTLSAGSQATQRVASGTEFQGYFIYGSYAVDQETTLSIREDWVPRASSETTATTVNAHQLAPPSGQFFSDMGRPAAEGSGLVKVTLASYGPGTITLTNVRRGFAKVEPAILTTGAATPDHPLVLTAALPGELTSASVEVYTAAGDFVASATTATLHGTSIHARWEPGDVMSGNYVGRFTLQAAGGTSLTLQRPFTIIHEPGETATVPVYQPQGFVRGIWINIRGGESAADTLATFQQAKADGFNFAIVLGSAPVLPQVRQAAEATAMPFSPFVPEISSILEEYTRRTWFSKADYLDRVRGLLAPVLDSPAFQGVYVYDEPFLPEAFDVLRRVNLSVAQDAGLGSPFTTFLAFSDFEAIKQVQPGIGMIDVYPYNLQVGGDPTVNLLNQIPLENEKARDFASIGRYMWLLPQAFIDRTREDYYPVPTAMHTAQLGAAVLSGARGTVPFHAQGLRGPGLSPTPMLDAYLKFNDTVARLSPLLMQLGVPELAQDVPYPFAVSTASGPDATYVFVLNAEDETTQTLLLQFETAPAAPPDDLVAQRPLPLESDGRVRVELGPGQWTLFSAGSATTVTIMMALPAEEPVVSTIDLPVTHAFVVPRLDGQGQPVLALEFLPNSRSIAASVGRFSFEPSEPMIFHLDTTGTATREPGPLEFPAERFGTTADGLFYRASPFIGIRMYPAGGFFDPPVAEYQGYSGGVFDTVREGGATWISMFDYGVRQLVDSPNGLQPVATGRANFGPYTDLFGPFADGSVISIVNHFGFSNIKPGQLHESQHRQTPLFGADRNAALSGNNVLAVPRHQYGFALAQLSANGETEAMAEIAADTLDATAVAWVYDSVLAVADGYKSIRFYEVNGTDANFIGQWRPPGLGQSYMLSLASNTGILTIGTLSGNVFIADTSALRPDTAANGDWQLLE